MINHAQVANTCTQGKKISNGTLSHLSKLIYVHFKPVKFDEADPEKVK